MNVTLCSAFRNASGYIGRYLGQVGSLGERLWNQGDHLSVVLCEGDSNDDTYSLLSDAISRRVDDYFPVDVDLFQYAHGGPDYGSVVNAERFANLAKVCNAIWRRIPNDSDAVVFVESDLQWEPSVMLALIDSLAEYPAIAPMVILRRNDYPDAWFYDVWAARKDGKHILPLPPYFPAWDMQEPLQVDSMGSCMAIRGDLARQLCWPDDVFVGLSRRIYELGGSVWLDPMQKVVHE